MSMYLSRGRLALPHCRHRRLAMASRAARLQNVAQQATIARVFTAFLPLLLLCACNAIPDRRPSSATSSAIKDSATRQCLGQLARQDVRFDILPDRNFGAGCSATGSIRLVDYGIPTTNLSAMTCPLADRFVRWVRQAVRPAARQHLESDIARIETFGTYSCRNVNGGASGKRSEHARANAVDVSAFVLKNGRRISVLSGWQGDGRDRKFLRAIHQGACAGFGTVLGPDYNRQHADHIHLDMAAGRYCR